MPSPDSFSWLHLTDLHFGLKDQDFLWPNLREPFFDDLAELHKRCGPWDAVLFTGDLVQSGKSEEYQKMQKDFLDRLWQELDKLDSGNAKLLAVPGNHDLYRPCPDDDPAAERLLDEDGFERIKSKFWDQPAGSYRNVVKNAFAAYEQWWQAAPHRPAVLHAGILPGDFAATLETRGGRKIGIAGLNTAFLQLGNSDYKGRLVWDARQLHGACRDVGDWVRAHDACLLLSHHGPDWLTEEARAQGESEIAPSGRFAAHLFGHQHETEITYLSLGASQKAARRLQGCSVFGMEKRGEPPKIERAHGYMAGSIGFEEHKSTLRFWPRIATNKTGRWRFIPDGENAELLGDQGTHPDTLSDARVGMPATHRADTPVVVGAGLPAINQASQGVPHSTLPSRRPFFGRTKELALIANYLSPDDRSWGVVLDGPGGMGKTALALEAAHRAPAELYPVKLWVTAKNRELRPEGEERLHDHKADDFYALLNELGHALGRDDIPKARPEDRPDLLRRALAGQKLLLVLDNLESFNTGERRRIFELLDKLPTGCRAIGTSRRRAGASHAGRAMSLDKLGRDAAEELLAELGSKWPPVARLTHEETDRLYAETGGNPLLLTWTAGQLGRTTGRCRTVEEAVARLQAAHEQQQQNEKNDPLDFVFGDLVETFSADETAALAALAHFTQPAKKSWLAPLAGLSEKAMETALDGLRDRSLLVEDEVSDTWLLPPLAARFLRRARPEAVGACGERLAERAYALSVENGYDNHERYPILEAAWSQIYAAFPPLLSGENQRLQAVCHALDKFLYFSGRWDEQLILSLDAEAKAVATQDWNNAGRRAYDAGYCHFLRSEPSKVLACAERAASHWQCADACSRDRTLAVHLRGLGHKIAMDFPAAIAAHRQVLEHFRNISPTSRDVAISLNDLGNVLEISEEHEQAESHFREALALAKSLPYPEGVSYITGNLARLALARGRWKEAEDLAREALKAAEPLGRKELVAVGSHYLAKSLEHQGRGAEGLCHAKRAVVLFAELRSPDLAEAREILAECLAASIESP